MSSAHAQDQSNGRIEVGALVGTLLPSGISGLTEITGLGGVRAGYKLGLPTVEATATLGNGDGANYRNLAVDLRLDVPIESFSGFFFLGLDLTDYAGLNERSKIFGGVDLGGGVLLQLGHQFYLRSDVKFTFNPGTSLFVDFGFMIRI